MGISVLGPLELDGEAARVSPRDRVVLSALALRPGQVATAEQLADAVWRETPPASWDKVVQGCIVRLRKRLGVAAIVTESRGYRLVLAPDSVDAQRFEHLLDRAAELMDLGDVERAGYLYEDALRLWRGPAFVDLEEWPAARGEVDRLEALRHDAEEGRVEAAVRAGRARDVLADAHALVRAMPLREHRWALLASAQYQAGRQAEALRTLGRARALLREELGLDPGPRLVDLESAILRQDPSLLVDPVTASPDASCPYPGLLAYDVADAEVYFGRGAELEAALTTLDAEGVLAIVGPSGTGKSSLAKAGVAASLAHRGVHVSVMSPGPHPRDLVPQLVASRPDGIVVVDQCEEVGADSARDERGPFLDALVSRAELGPVVVVIRADRLGDLCGHPGFARLVERGLLLLGPLSQESLRATIEGPARSAGLLLEAGLVDLLIAEVRDEPGALPMLSHALRQTWLRRQGRVLTVAAYQETGGIRGAVAQTAEAVYGAIPLHQRAAVRDLLLRLVTPSSSGEPISTPVSRRMVAGDTEHDELLERLVAARLLTSDDDAVELAHESLAREWPRLRAWLDEDVEGQRILRHLASAAETWQSMGRPDSELYRGPRLDQAVSWRDRSSPDLTATETDFLARAEEVAESDLREAADRAHAQVRENRRLRMLLAVVATLLAASVVAASIAWSAQTEADAQARAADARSVGSKALTTSDLDHAVLLAASGVRLDDSPDTRGSLLGALSRSPQLSGSLRLGAPQIAMDVSPDGSVLAVGGAFDGTTFVDPETLRSVGFLALAPGEIVFDPDGSVLAVAVNPVDSASSGLTMPPTPLVLVDPHSFVPDVDQLAPQPANSYAMAVAFSGDGRRIVGTFFPVGAPGTSSTPSRIIVWDLAAPRTPLLDIPGGEEPQVALSRDGSRLFVVDGDVPRLVVRDLRSPGRAGESVDVPYSARICCGPYLALRPDGAQLAMTDGDSVALVDLADHSTTTLRGHGGPVGSLHYSRDGSRLVSTSDDGTAIVWDVAHAAAAEHLVGHASQVRNAVFSPDGGSVFSTSHDRSLLAWDLTGAHRFVPRTATVDPRLDQVDGLLPSPDGLLVAIRAAGPQSSAFGQGEVVVADAGSGRILSHFEPGHGPPGRWSWSPDSRRLATTGEDGVVRLWDVGTGTPIASRSVSASAAASVAFSAGGDQILVSSRDGHLQLARTEDLSPIGRSMDLGTAGSVRSADLAPDGRTVLVTTWEARYLVVDLKEERITAQGEIGFPVWSTAISPDGGRAVVGGNAGEVRAMDLSSGRWLDDTVIGHADAVESVAFSRDGSVVVTGSNDGRVGLWDARSMRLLGTVQPGAPAVLTAARPLDDGSTIRIAQSDGSVFTWDTRVEHWIAVACREAGRDLTASEWTDAFGSRPYEPTCANAS